MWDLIISAIVSPRLRAAAQLGVGENDLWSVARLSALEAQRTWKPGAGATASSWVYLHVAGDVSKVLARAGRELASDTAADELEDRTDLEVAAIMRESLVILQARLAPDEYRLLWLRHALGFTSAELAGLYEVPDQVIRQRLSRARKRAVTILGLAA